MQIIEIVNIDDDESLLDLLRHEIGTEVLALRKDIAAKSENFAINSVDTMSPDYLAEHLIQVNELLTIINKAQLFTPETQSYRILVFLAQYLNGE